MLTRSEKLTPEGGPLLDASLEESDRLGDRLKTHQTHAGSITHTRHIHRHVSWEANNNEVLGDY